MDLLGVGMMKIEVNFKYNGFCQVYFDGDDVIIDNGAYRYRKRICGGKKKDVYSLFIAVGDFMGTFKDEIIDYEVIR